MCESLIDYSSDCFDHRICDDLSQLLLSHLSIDDKIQLQFVSKQFQYCIIKSQKQLIVSEFENLLKTERPEHISDGLGKVWVKTLVHILKMFRFINNIKINQKTNSSLNHRNIAIFVEFIVKYCNDLKEISIESNILKKSLITSFGRKFGQSLEKIVFNDNSFQIQNQVLIKLCPNLISIENISLNAFSDNNQIIVLKKLKHISGLGIDENNYQIFYDFCDKYKNQIKSLGFNSFNQNRLTLVFDQISKLINLEKLSLTSIYRIQVTDEILKLFEKFSLNCIQLNTLSVYFLIETSAKTRNILKSICNFKNLTKLELHLYCHYSNETKNQISFEKLSQHRNQLKCLSLRLFIKISDQTINVLKSINNFENLTKLELYLSCYSNETENQQTINELNINCNLFENLINISHLRFDSNLLTDNFFTDIDIYFPKLKILEISCKSNIITDKALYSLSKLKNIEKIRYDMFHDFTYFTGKAFLHLINNCLKLRYISIKCEIKNTTNETIDEIISLVSKREKTEFVFELNFGTNNEIFGSKLNSIQNILFKPLYYRIYYEGNDEESDEESDEEIVEIFDSEFDSEFDEESDESDSDLLLKTHFNFV